MLVDFEKQSARVLSREAWYHCKLKPSVARLILHHVCDQLSCLAANVCDFYTFPA